MNFKIFKVEDNNKIRLDKFLKEKIQDFSRTEIQKLEVKKILNNKEIEIKFSDLVKTGDEFKVIFPDKKIESSELKLSKNINLSIIYEDEDIIVIDKPRNIVVYPSIGNYENTLIQNILSHTNLASIGKTVRPGVVHRLDKNTSGVMIFAKSITAYTELLKTFSTHNLVRKYVTFVWGIPNWETAEIKGNIARSRYNRQKMSIVQKGGKNAETIIEVINVWNKENISEFRCKLMTGRTHQIRVHLSSHGFPIIADDVYGKDSKKIGSLKNKDLFEFIKKQKGQLLHAELLEIDHPVTKKRMSFKSKIPTDMQTIKNILNNNN